MRGPAAKAEGYQVGQEYWSGDYLYVMTATGWQFTGTYKEVPDPNNPLVWVQRSVTDATQAWIVNFTQQGSTGWIYVYVGGGLLLTEIWRGSYTSLFAGNDASNVFVDWGNSWVSVASLPTNQSPYTSGAQMGTPASVAFPITVR